MNLYREENLKRRGGGGWTVWENNFCFIKELIAFNVIRDEHRYLFFRKTNENLDYFNYINCIMNIHTYSLKTWTGWKKVLTFLKYEYKTNSKKWIK